MTAVLERKEIKRQWEKEFSVGDERAIQLFAESIGDWNPLHHNHIAANDAGLRGIIAPGVMMAGFISSTIAQEVPGVMVCRLQIDFMKPLYAGSIPIVQCIVMTHNTTGAKISFTVTNGDELAAKGSCLLLYSQPIAYPQTIAK